MWAPTKPKKIKLSREIVRKLVRHADNLEELQSAMISIFGYSESGLQKQLLHTKMFLRELAEAAGYPNGTDQ